VRCARERPASYIKSPGQGAGQHTGQHTFLLANDQKRSGTERGTERERTKEEKQ